MKKIVILLLILNINLFSATIKGIIKDNEKSLPAANIYISELKIKTSTNKNGEFSLQNIPTGEFKIECTFIGYKKYESILNIKSENDELFLEIELVNDFLQNEDIVITGTRTEIPLNESPIVTDKISSQLFQSVQAVSLSEGLSFSPGLRFETNCGNCGFSQVRMNGLQGPYTQILINSRAIYSALTGVYGLEMIPSNMIERVEVVRGGGSALYGGNAIAGTINIITKEPTFNNYEVMNNLAFTNIERLDNTLMFNGSLVTNDLNSGITFYGMNRNREPWDANGDSFSELVKIDNNSFGIDGYYYPDSISKIKFNLFTINEERRGGNKFNLEPHQADIAEYLDHKILGNSLSYERAFNNFSFSIYNSNQYTDRNSYYGAGGRVLNTDDELSEEDILALNSYGNSNDLVSIIGAQLSNKFDDFSLVYGSELNYNGIRDKFIGYNREIEQDVTNIGSYFQANYKYNKLNILGGFRHEHIILDGNYNYDNVILNNDRTFDILVPRLSLMYRFENDLKFRTSFAQGFRAPQAFDEDLHIQTIGGAVRFINIDDNLKPELSDNYNFSIDKTYYADDFQTNFLIDLFFTNLRNAFIFSDPVELENGISTITKRNGSGSRVYGANIELNFAYKYLFQLQTGLTIQRAEYIKDEEIWRSDDGSQIVSTNNILKTPENYGYLNATYFINDVFTLDISSIYTGIMIVPHVIDIDSEFTELKEVSSFFELNLKLSYDYDFQNNCLTFSLGCQNILNNYQNDFDFGIDKDGSYVYGPARPRTIYLSLKYSN
jgi:outer membrane receptor for ferrienterochelin and colicins